MSNRTKTKITVIALSLAMSVIIPSFAVAEPPETWTPVPQETNDIDRNFNVGSVKNFVRKKVIGFIIKSLNAENFLTGLNQDLSVLAGDIETFLSDRNLEPTLGKIGIPNVQEVRKFIAEHPILGELSDVLGTQTGTTFGNREQLYQQYLKDLSQSYSENSALSLEGQSKLDAKVETMISAAEQSINIADDSTGQDISQNIMRNVSNQLAISQQANAMIFSDLQDAKVDRSLGLQIDAEILTELAQSNQYRQRQDAAANNDSISSHYMVSIPGIF